MEKTTELAVPDGPLSSPNSTRVVMFQSFTVPSLPAEANVLPSGEKTTELIPPLCALSVAGSCFAPVSQSVMVSPLAEASVWPPGEKATDVIGAGWVRVARAL